MTLTSQDKAAILRSVSIDPHLSSNERQLLLNQIAQGDSFWQKHLGGAVGAGISLAISRYLKLSTTSQVLVTLAGFGLGKYLLDKSDDSTKFMEYNKQLKGYKLNS